MKFLNKIQNNSLAILILLIFNFALSNHAVAQSCNQVDILFTAPDCSSGKNAAGGQERGCKEASACVNQTYNYASSLTGTGWTYNWNVTGPTSVSINPNNTSPSISISWPQAGAYTLNLTVTDASGNSFTKCLTVTVLERPNANFNICLLYTSLATIEEVPVHPPNSAPIAIESARRALARAGYDFDALANETGH